MKFKLKTFLGIFVAFSLAFQSFCFADELTSAVNSLDSSDKDGEQQVLTENQEAGIIIGSIIEFIQENYMGGEADTKELMNAAIKGMTDVLDDYSTYYTNDEYREFERTLETDIYIIGVVTTQASNDYPVVTDILEDSPADKAGILAGDKIISINNISLKGVSIQSVTELLSVDGARDIDIEISRNNKIMTVHTQFTEAKVNTVYINDIDELISGENNFDNSQIGYMKVSLISNGTADEFKDAINELKKEGKKRLILDLRGNGGGIVDEAMKMCDEIIPEGTIIYTKDKAGNTVEYKSELKNKSFDKIVVLTDSLTASAAEMIASAVQDSGAGIVVGDKTYGKGVIQTMVPIFDDGVLKMTTLEYFSRNGKKINHVGVIPNVYVSVPLYLGENDSIESDKVKKALEYLGFDVSTKLKTMTTISKIQKDNKLTVTRSLDKETANQINLMIYEEKNNNDKIFNAGYEEIIKDMQ